ncbi:MAG: hypothetical protein J0M36_09260 [Caulobacterales bacterium]|nr:hypothetical protein [Caulobacterales bacterium]
MIRALSLAAALAVLPVSAAVAADEKTQAETAIEKAAASFEARMEAFGERAETIAQDASLTETQREVRIKTLWAEYAPDVAAFTATVSEQAGVVAASALAEMDIEALVAEALEGADIEGEIADALADEKIGVGVERAVTTGVAMAANGAWAQNDPEQMVTYGLVAQYALDQASREANEDAADADN